MAQEVYRIDHGEFASSLSELEPYLGEVPDANSFHLRSDGTTWSIAIARSGGFAGNHLLTSDGKLYFNPTAAATSADIVLCDLSKRYRRQ
jgi:hypothetical protein